ncbi:MAG: LptF/LptG family permease [Fimbriimonadaceae bacterium]|nr:LptF/LptG family permease [Fimbriimonadaceae bacterium]
MKRLDFLVVKEVAPMWGSSFFLFSVLISAGQFLFELTNLISQGAPFASVVQLALYILPGILAKSFPMGMLLATLLAFGRLSGDSEIVALRAGGVSLGRIMLPVAGFGLLVSLMTFGFNEVVVPWASTGAIKVRAGIEGSLQKARQQSASQPFYQDDRLVGFINAENVDLRTQTLSGVTVVYLGDDGQPASVLQAGKLRYTDLKDWEIIGQARVYDLKSRGDVLLEEGAWPRGREKPAVSLDDIISRTLRDLDVYNMGQMRERIARMRADPSHDKAQLANLEFGYWNKIAIPLGALVFGLLGAPLGIRRHRAGAATGFALSVVIIFGYFMLTNVLAVMSKGGIVPPWAASFVPVVVGVASAAYLIRRRNVQ